MTVLPNVAHTHDMSPLLMGVTECIQLSLLKTRAPCLFEENRNASMGWGKLRLSDIPINTVGILLHSSGNPCKHPSSPPRDFLIGCDYHLLPLRLYPPLAMWLNSLAGKFATGSETEQKMFISLENTRISRTRQLLQTAGPCWMTVCNLAMRAPTHQQSQPLSLATAFLFISWAPGQLPDGVLRKEIFIFLHLPN